MAQLVARLVWDQEVRGSSPRTPIPCGSNSVVEFLPSKQAVAGSSPVSRFFFKTVSLEALHRPLYDKQAVMMIREDGFVCGQKAYSDHLSHNPCDHLLF